ncbi:hypothetical protein V2K24_05085 [Pseudomonas alliivorans]|nr:hypothetical protein [Pseudomonas alliivorans]
MPIQGSKKHGFEHGNFDNKFRQRGKANNRFSKSIGLRYRYTFSISESGRIRVMASEGNREFSIRSQLFARSLGLMARVRLWGCHARGAGHGTTDKFLAAHRFYEKHGFSEVARGNLPESFPLMAVDSRFYVLGLKG